MNIKAKKIASNYSDDKEINHYGPPTWHKPVLVRIDLKRTALSGGPYQDGTVGTVEI